jgi:hypothetical protein
VQTEFGREQQDIMNLDTSDAVASYGDAEIVENVKKLYLISFQSAMID